MPSAQVFESSDIQISGMRAEALDLDSAFCSTGHIRQIQIAVAVIEIPDLPFRKEMIEIPDSGKPDRAQKFSGSVP